MLTTTSTDSSLTLIFQDSTIVAMSDGAKAAFAHRAALFVRDHYDEYRDVRRVNIRFATSRYAFPAAALGLPPDSTSGHD